MENTIPADEPRGTKLDFDEVQGTFRGVPAYSNLDDSYFSGEKAFYCGVQNSFKWQCVEYARRYLMTVKGCRFGECKPRSTDAFYMDTVEHLETGEEFPFIACKNGESTRKPEPGDIQLYPWVPDKLDFGHIDVISAVGDDWVGIIEQNVDCKAHGEGKVYFRTEKLSQDPETKAWTISCTEPDRFVDCLGWKYVEGVPDREIIAGSTTDDSDPLRRYKPLKILPKFHAHSDPMEGTPYEVPNVPLPPRDDNPSLKALEEEEVRGLPSRREAVEALVSAKRTEGDVGDEGSEFLPRTKEWETMIRLNESAFTSSVGTVFRSFQWLHTTLKEYFASHPSDEALAKVLSIFAPTSSSSSSSIIPSVPSLEQATLLVAAMRRELSAAPHDCPTGFGTAHAIKDFSAEATRVYRFSYDHLDGLIPLVMSERVPRHAGWANAFPAIGLETAIKRYFTRLVSTHQRRFEEGKSGEEQKTDKKKGTILFIDFGDENSSFFELLLQQHQQAAAEEYLTERRQWLYIAHAAQIEQNNKGHDGNPMQWVAKILPFDQVSIRSASNSKTSFISFQQQEEKKEEVLPIAVFKCAPWASIFTAMHAGGESETSEQQLLKSKLHSLVFDVAAHSLATPTPVFQPLWCVAAEHPSTPLLFAKTVEAATQKAKEEGEDVMVPPTRWAMPSDKIGADGSVHLDMAGCLTPEMKREPVPAAGVKRTGPSASADPASTQNEDHHHHPVLSYVGELHFVADAKYAGSIFMEGRRVNSSSKQNKKDEEDGSNNTTAVSSPPPRCTVSQLVQPAARFIVFGDFEELPPSDE